MVSNMKTSTIRIIVLTLVVLMLVPVFAYIIIMWGNTSNNQQSTIETKQPYTEIEKRITLPFKPGDNITLQYILVGSNGTSKTILDSRKITYHILSIKFPYIITSKGVLPIEFIHPVTPSEDPNNPHFLYVSFYFNDKSCMMLSNTTTSNYYKVYPKKGCTKFTGDVLVDNKGVLEKAKLVQPVSKGLLMEYVYVVSYTSSGVTRVRYDPYGYLCFNSISPIIMYTAPGMYLVENGRIKYVGKVDMNSSDTIIVLSKDRVGDDIWTNITTGKISIPNGTLIFVVSPLFQTQLNETNYISINGKVVASGEDVITWIREHYG